MKKIMFLLALTPTAAWSIIGGGTTGGNKELGESCTTNSECFSGICACSSPNALQDCRPMGISTCVEPATLHESCTSFQTDAYILPAIPCAKGLECNDSGRCIDPYLRTNCPSNFIAIDEKHLTIATNCPSDTVSVGTADSCFFPSPSGNCIMYAPADVSHIDQSGIYKFNEPCTSE